MFIHSIEIGKIMIILHHFHESKIYLLYLLHIIRYTLNWQINGLENVISEQAVFCRFTRNMTPCFEVIQYPFSLVHGIGLG